MNDAGRIGFLIRGDYNNNETYDFLDVVYYNGSSYVAKKPTVGHEPQENNEYWQIFAEGSGVGVTGVKGNKESSYRKGDVNLTPENIGAVSKSEDNTITGKLLLRQDYNVHNSSTSNVGQSRYVKVARINITRTYADVPIIFEVLKRQTVQSSIISVLFYSTGNLDPDVKKVTYYGAHYEAYIAKADTGTWDLYIKDVGYGSIAVTRLQLNYAYDRATVTWVSEYYDTLPDGAIKASHFLEASIAKEVSNEQVMLTGSENDGSSLQMANRNTQLGDFNISIDNVKVIGNTAIIPSNIDPGITEYVTIGAEELAAHAFHIYNTSSQRIGYGQFDGNWNIEGTYQTQAGDYAEYWEWIDGNVNTEDRVGLFVTFSGNKIRLSQAGDNLAKIGIVSATPSVLGDSDNKEWRKKYLTDIYGRCLYEESIDEKGRLCRNRILNPEYEESQEYRERKDRPEWDAIATHGKLVVRDDGTCQPDSFCVPTDGGIATAADNGFYVMERLDKNHIRVYVR